MRTRKVTSGHRLDQFIQPKNRLQILVRSFYEFARKESQTWHLSIITYVISLFNISHIHAYYGNHLFFLKIARLECYTINKKNVFFFKHSSCVSNIFLKKFNLSGLAFKLILIAKLITGGILVHFPFRILSPAKKKSTGDLS